MKRLLSTLALAAIAAVGGAHSAEAATATLLFDLPHSCQPGYGAIQMGVEDAGSNPVSLALVEDGSPRIATIDPGQTYYFTIQHLDTEKHSVVLWANGSEVYSASPFLNCPSPAPAPKPVAHKPATRPVVHHRVASHKPVHHRTVRHTRWHHRPVRHTRHHVRWHHRPVRHTRHHVRWHHHRCMHWHRIVRWSTR